MIFVKTEEGHGDNLKHKLASRPPADASKRAGAPRGG
jgi:hypothetical protein